MTLLLIPFASDWQTQIKTCHFQASAEMRAGGTVPLTAKDDSAPVYAMPDDVLKVTVTAKPIDSHFWPTTVELFVTNGGTTFENADLLTAWVKLEKHWDAPTVKSMSAAIRVSRFKDVTTKVAGLLSAPPSRRSLKIKDEWIPVDIDAAKQLAQHRKLYGSWPPDNWNVSSTPAHYLNASKPVDSGKLNFAVDTSLSVASESVVLELAGVDAPKLFSVVWPLTSIHPAANAAPTPFLLFIRQGNKGNKYDELGQFVYHGNPSDAGILQPYPYNFDYAASMFECLHYSSLLTAAPIGNAPFYKFYQKGVPYQVAKAGVQAVTVVPCNSFEQEFGVLEDTEQTHEILKELQAFMFSQAGVLDPPKRIGDTVIAAFSSGTVYLDKWLNNSKNRTGDFLSNVVRAVYFLEPILDLKHKTRDVNDYIPVALNWATGDKRVRLYMRFPSDAHKKLLSPKAPPGDTPYFANSAGDRFTAAVITREDWIAAFKKVTNVSLPQEQVVWHYPHHLIAGTMLTHALKQGTIKDIRPTP